MAQSVNNLPAVQEAQFRSLSWEDPLEEEMATCSRILVCKILWSVEPGGLHSMGSQRVRYNRSTEHTVSLTEAEKLCREVKFGKIGWIMEH